MDIRNFDWRIYGVTTLSQDIPSTGLGSPEHKAGTPVYPATMAEWNSTIIYFGTPSTIKLIFNSALTASIDALIAKEKIDFIPHGNGWMVPPEKFIFFYDYFERYMMTVIYSFLTLEIFCNFVIDSKVGKNTVLVKLNNKPKYHNALELQKENVSVKRKLLEILPKIIDIPPIDESDKNLWENIEKMTITRNKITHMKPADINRGGMVDRDSIFAEIINNTPVNFPFYTLKVMEYYESGLIPKFWIEQMKSQYITRFKELK